MCRMVKSKHKSGSSKDFLELMSYQLRKDVIEVVGIQ
jgi:hypothetical protein